MSKHRTEQVYDDEMSPLVAQLIAIAKREGIPLLVSAGMLCVADGDGEDFDEPIATTCDTLVYTDDARALLPGIVNRYSLAKGVVRGHKGFDTACGLMISRYPEGQHGPLMTTLVAVTDRAAGGT